MKRKLQIIGFIFLTGCSKKTHQVDRTNIASYLKSETDSARQRRTVTTDKSVTTVEKQLDTTIIFNGTAISGYLTHKDSNAYAHFENQDLSLDLSTYNGIIKAIATPKTRKISLKFNDKTIIANNISTTVVESSKLKNNVVLKTDSVVKHETNQSDPIISFSVLSNIIKWFFIVALIVGALFYFGKKFIPL